MGKKIAVLVVILCCLGMPLHADEISLNNGDQLKGSVVGLNEQVVLLATASGDLIIPRDKVVSVILAGETPAPSAGKGHPVKMHFENPTPALQLGAVGGDFLEE
jgi:hypothetical protein